jgi:hypothetical protein
MIGFFSLFRALSLKLRIAVIVGGIAAILAGYGLWHHKVFNSGWNAAIAAIAAQDRRAIDEARSARAIGALALTVTACGTLRPASVGGGECRVFERPEYAVFGQTRYDQNWIDSNTEAGVAACRWQRPKPRPQVLGRPPGAKHRTPPKQKPGLIGRIKRTIAPSANAQSPPPATIPTPEPSPIPAPTATPRDPVDELLEPTDAPPAKPPRRPCWWC